MQKNKDNDKFDKKGRNITCRVCNHKFRFDTKTKRNNWEYNKKSICPNKKCLTLYCNKPDTERKLMILQDLYFKSGRKQIYMSEITKLLLIYSESLIKKFFSNLLQQGKSLQYLSENAVSFLVEEYYKNKDYYIYGSFGGALFQKIKQVGFDKKTDISNISIDYIMEDGNKIQIKDTTENWREIIDNKEDSSILSKNIIEIISKSDFRYDNHTFFAGLIHLFLRIINGERQADLFSKAYKNVGRWAYGDMLELMKNEIYGSLKQS